MSQGTPPPSPPPPPPEGQPSPPNESFQVKAQRLLNKVMPPVDPAEDTPEAKMQRMLYLVAAIGVVLLLLVFCLAGVISVFT